MASSMARHRFFGRDTRLVPRDRVVGAHAHTRPACRRRRLRRRDAGRRQRVCATCHQDVPRQLEERAPQQDDSAGDRRQRQGDFSKDTLTLEASRSSCAPPTAPTSSPSRYSPAQPREHRVEYTLGSRRIQHYLTTIEQGSDHRADAKLGRPAPRPGSTTWKSSGRTRTIERRSSSGTRTVSGATSASRTTTTSPATQTYATAWNDFGTSCERCHGPGSAHVDKYRERQPRRLAIARSCGRPASTRTRAA